jgi:hypothetical protein
MRDINKHSTFWLSGANLLTSVSHPPLGGLHQRILQNRCGIEIEMLFVLNTLGSKRHQFDYYCRTNDML